jgi:hypothetical protein
VGLSGGTIIKTIYMKRKIIPTKIYRETVFLGKHKKDGELQGFRT